VISTLNGSKEPYFQTGEMRFMIKCYSRLLWCM